MTAAEFTRLVEQPYLVKDVNLADLHALVTRYPFCASAHLLLIKKYRLDNHPDFDAHLAAAAAYAHDRKALYRLLYDETKFKPTEEIAVTDEQRVGAEIMMGNESGAFADYTPKNQVAEVETFESFEFDRNNLAEGLRALEQETGDRMTFELQEQFVLANAAAGSGAEISHDFDDLEESNEEELVEEKKEAEIEATKALDEAIEESVAETDYMELATASLAGAEVTHRFDNLEEQKDELVDDDFDAELESTKLLEGAIEHAVVEPDYNELATNAGQNGIGKHETETSSPAADERIEGSDSELNSEQTDDSPRHAIAHDQDSNSVKEEIGLSSQFIDNETESNQSDEFSPSSGLAALLQESDSTSSQSGSETELAATDKSFDAIGGSETQNVTSSHQGIEEEELELGLEANEELETVIAEASLPTSLEEHGIKPEDVTNPPVESVTENATVSQAGLTPRQELHTPIAEEDLAGTIHQKITSETESAYRHDDASTHQGSTAPTQMTATGGARSFMDWLRMYRQKDDTKDVAQRIKQEQAPPAQRIPENAAAKETSISASAEHDDDLYDREWQARKLELESWTAGLPDELKVIDEFVAEQTDKKETHQASKTVAELAQKSLEQNDDFVTETMARIYASQGKYRKAAEVVEKLMLKNPSKRPYFADLLEEYRKKITPQ